MILPEELHPEIRKEITNAETNAAKIEQEINRLKQQTLKLEQGLLLINGRIITLKEQIGEPIIKPKTTKD